MSIRVTKRIEQRKKELAGGTIPKPVEAAVEADPTPKPAKKAPAKKPK